MSRSGYSDGFCNDDPLMYGRWRAQVASSTRGKRGQKLLRDLVQALDEMPVKELITHELKRADGSYCTLGVLGEKRGLDLESLDPEDYDCVGKAFDIASPLAQEIVYMNDEYCEGDTPTERWTKMRKWVGSLLKDDEK